MATYDISTDAGKVRLLVGDTNTAAAVFEDSTIDAFLSLESSNVYAAAALALESLAANRVRVLQVVDLLDLKLDGEGVARGLRMIAVQYRERSRQGDGDWAGFEIAETPVDHFSARERIWKQFLREDQ